MEIHGLMYSIMNRYALNNGILKLLTPIGTVVSITITIL